MRKKIFTLLTLMLAVCSGALAETDSYVADDRNAASVTSESSYTGDAFTFSKSGNWTITQDYSKASADDGSGLKFAYGCLPGGTTSSSACYTLTALKDISSLKIYYTLSDSKFGTKDQSKSGSFIYQIDDAEAVTLTSVAGSNKVAYSATITSITTGQAIKIYSSASRLVIFGIYATYTADGISKPKIGFSDNTVTMTCSTDDAKIYYTIDGTTPTSSSSEYTSGVALTGSCTVQAIAIKDEESSDVTSQDCFVDNSSTASYLTKLTYNGGDVSTTTWTAASGYSLAAATNNIQYTAIAGADDGFKLNANEAYTITPPSDVKITKIVFVGKTWLEGTATLSVTGFTPASDSFYATTQEESVYSRFVKTIEFTPSTDLSFGQTVSFTPSGTQLGAYIEIYGEQQTYNITHSTATNGTYTIKVGSADAVSTDTKAVRGATVTLSATPSEGYTLNDWNVTKTASGDAVTVTDNTFTMPAEAVTVAPTFVRCVTLTWNIQVNVEETTVTTSSTSSSNTTYVAAPSNLGLTDLTVTSDKKGTATNKISTTKAKGGYVSATFDVKSGYMFTPTKMELATTAITEAITIEVNVGDEVQTWAQPKSASSPDEHTYTFSDAKAYTGTVTMKIYAYGGSDGTKGFRLGTPIKVYGKISEISGPADPTTSGDEVYLTTSGNMAGWRAFYDAEQGYDLDVNTKAYIATEQDGDDAIKLKSIGRVPAATPVILYTTSSADSHKMTLTKATVAAYDEGTDGANLLQYTTSAVTDKYRLGFGGNGVGFYPYTGVPTSGAVILNVSSASARALSIVFDEEETGIKKIESAASDKENGAYFNLAGQRVAQPTKGLYIVNGKKVVIK